MHGGAAGLLQRNIEQVHDQMIITIDNHTRIDGHNHNNDHNQYNDQNHIVDHNQYNDQNHIVDHNHIDDDMVFCSMKLTQFLEWGNIVG